MALWWMHFHRPISVIFQKQDSDSILWGISDFLWQSHRPYLFSYFSACMFTSTIFLRSIINCRNHQCWPWMTLTLKLGFVPVLSIQALVPVLSLRHKMWRPGLPQGQVLTKTVLLNNRRPFLSTSPQMPHGLSLFRLIGYAATSLSQSIQLI